MAQKAIVVIIRCYQYCISPWLGPTCRYHPSCSEYAIQAFDAHRFFKAGWLTLKRLGRCHPFHPGGYDPVPRGKNS